MTSVCRWSSRSAVAFLFALAVGACAGGAGENGENSLIRISPEAAGSNCPKGGSKVEAGLDANGNGALDADEVDQTSYVCNGDTGAGQNGLVATTPEPAGTNCPQGGAKVEVGLDANGNGVLDPTEVNAAATTYVCNGPNGLVATSPEPAGANCVAGGTRVDSGVDANGNGVLDLPEISRTQYVCNGAGGLTGPAGISAASTGIHASVISMSTDATAPITVRFTLKDDRGCPIDVHGVYSLNTAISPSFGLAYEQTDADGNMLPYVVLTKSIASAYPTAQPTWFSPLSTTVGSGTLTENGYGAGDYTYTFPTTSQTPTGPQAVAYDATRTNATHVLWIGVTRQTDLVNTTAAHTFSATNQPYWYVPDASSSPVVREVAKTENCNSCHRGFQPERASTSAFHGGKMNDVRVCGICHNPARQSNPAAEASSYIHRIHDGENLQPSSLFHGLVFGFPRDIRNCDTCHANAAQGAQAQGHPSQKACGSCHDYVSFAGTGSITCTDPVTIDPTTKLPMPCNHISGIQTDSSCKTCHTATAIAGYHKQVAPPDPNNIWNTGGTNSSTNAAWIAATGYLPTGASRITYVVQSVRLVDDATITPNKRLQAVFKLQKDGTDVVFRDPSAATEIMANYVGSPSVYFAFAVPQDGVTAPADFNATASGYVKNIWNGTATGTGAGTLTGPDGNGFYTMTLTGVQVPPTATLLTGGVGYSYSLSSTPPLTQTNVAGYAYNTTTKQGGLIVPAPDVWKTADGFTARRPIVDNNKCQNCHAPLGVEPTFHVGQRNDGPTCSFCHTPNRTSSGWSVGSRSYIHAIHGARKRDVPFNWHASSVTEGYWDIEFPGPLNDCTACHLPGTYNFRATTTSRVMDNMLVSTVGQGTYAAGGISTSPYVIADGVTNYGTGFSFAGATSVSTEATGTTLVSSPITDACGGCHDSSAAIGHMRTMGGSFYAPRSTALGANAPVEQCLICHGPGTGFDIEIVH